MRLRGARRVARGSRLALSMDIFGYCCGHMRMFCSLHCDSCDVVELSPATATHGRPLASHSRCMRASSAPMSTPSCTPARARALTQL